MVRTPPDSEYFIINFLYFVDLRSERTPQSTIEQLPFSSRESSYPMRNERLAVCTALRVYFNDQ